MWRRGTVKRWSCQLISQPQPRHLPIVRLPECAEQRRPALPGGQLCQAARGAQLGPGIFLTGKTNQDQVILRVRTLHGPVT